MRAYWFSNLDGTTVHQTEPAEVGRTDHAEGAIIPCQNGLHGSPTPWDALQYAGGPVLWVVELAGEIVSHGDPVDKHAASERKYISKIDLTKTLCAFAARRALTVIHLWNAPEVVKEYLTKTANFDDAESIRAAARDATRDAATAAAWDAATDAAKDAATAAAIKQFNEMAQDALEKAGGK